MIAVYWKDTRVVISLIPGFPEVTHSDGRFSIIGNGYSVKRAKEDSIAYGYYHDVDELPDIDIPTPPVIDDLGLIELTPEEIDKLINPPDLPAEIEALKARVDSLEAKITAQRSKSNF